MFRQPLHCSFRMDRSHQDAGSVSTILAPRPHDVRNLSGSIQGQRASFPMFLFWKAKPLKHIWVMMCYDMFYLIRYNMFEYVLIRDNL